MTPGQAPRRVVIVGTGLIGTSAALALRRHGTQVWLSDAAPAAAELAADLGAGQVLPAAGVPGGP
ncbi:MAG TPA: NAD-binding protein, partial [Streptosporangiaceae bacterium]